MGMINICILIKFDLYNRKICSRRRMYMMYVSGIIYSGFYWKSY